MGFAISWLRARIPGGGNEDELYFGLPGNVIPGERGKHICHPGFIFYYNSSISANIANVGFKRAIIYVGKLKRV
jgi:hypothetical protein